MSSLTDDFDEIDDKEFAIPSIDGPLPTLESILNEEDNDSIISDLELDANEVINGLNPFVNEFIDSTENSSISSLDSRGLKKLSSALLTNDTNVNTVSSNGSVLRHSVLKSLSAQLKSADTDRINAGKPTVLTVSTNYIAVGTSHGFVLVFDLRQVMKSCLRNNEDLGSVSAMDIKKDNSRLICGYSRGSVTLWNLQSGELIRLMNELHSPQTTVLHLKYMSDNNFGALSDSSGCVFMLDFRRKDVDSQCIFSGSRGEVLAIEPLLLPPTESGEILNFNNICLISMATVTKVIAISMRPQLTVQFTQILKGDSDTLPLLRWQFVMVQMSADTRVIDPVLSFGRQNNIYFFQASFKSSSKILFTPLMQINVEYLIQSIVWLNSRTIATIDELEKIHVLDVRSEEELEVIEMDKIQMVYGSAHFKSLENGQNVSPAMTIAADRACYHSISVSNSTLSNNSSSNLLILGINSVHLFTIRNWSERIDTLITENRYIEALALTHSFYANTAKAVIGLSGKKTEKRKFVAKKMNEILINFMESTITSIANIDPDCTLSTILYFKNLISISIQYCLSIEDNYQMLNELFERYSEDSIAKKLFLESLEAHVLKWELKNLSPIITQEFITCYEEKEMFDTLEAVVTHLEITSLDIHHVMTVCRKHNLFDAIIYIHNNAFDDYMTPFDELIQKLEFYIRSGQQLTEDVINFGNKLFGYISALLKGRSFTTNRELESEKKLILIKDILSRITKPTDTYSHDSNGSNSSAKDVISFNPYPNLKILLLFDIKEFLDVMSNAFQSFDFENEFLSKQKQRFVDILVQVMVENIGFHSSQIGALFIFIAKLLANKRNTISVNNTLIDQIIEYIFTSDDESSADEREGVLLYLLQSEVELVSDENKILRMAQNSNFFGICEYIYVKNRNWSQNLSTYIRDPKRKTHVFDYINQILMSSNVSEEEKTVFIENIYSNIKSLIEIDFKNSAKFLLDYLEIEKFDFVLTSLETEPKVLYKLLFGLLLGKTNKRHKRDPSTGSINFETLSVKEQRKQTLITDPKIQEKLIELMAEFEPKSVYKTLNILEDYRSENALIYCREHNIVDGTAYLLEKTSKFEEAFSLLHKELNEKIKDFVDSDIDHFWDQIENKMRFLIDFCRRCSAKMVESKDKETVWLSLVESMLTISQLIKSSTKTNPFEDHFNNKLRELMNKLIEGINGTNNMISIMETIINNPSVFGGSGETSCDLMDLFSIVYKNYSYEETLLQTTNNLLLNELHQQLDHLRKDVNKANSNRHQLCPICSVDLNFEDNVVLFHCSHSFHENCVAINKDKEPICPICQSLTGSGTDVHGIHQSINRLSLSSDPQRIGSMNTNSSQTKGVSIKLKLSESQLNSLEYLKRGQRIDSRANILNQLPNTGIRLASTDGPTDHIFQLKLAPQWTQISQ